MAYIYGQRSEYTMFPKSIDEYVGEQDPVRVYDAFINALDFKNLGISLDPYKSGPEEYDPKTMLKIIVYGYANSQRSSRKLERCCHRDVSFMWLTGGLAPDYRTIARFRRDNAEAIRQVLREIVRLCIAWDLIEGNALFIDSTAMEANASLRKTFTPENCKERLKKLDAHIDKLLKESEHLDQEQEDHGSLVKVNKELLNCDKIRAEIQVIEQQLKEESLKQLNTTDAECVTVKSSGRCRAGYKAQTVVDDKHGLIVSTDVVASGSDMHQLSRQIENARDMLGHKPQTVVSDSGYSCVEDAAKIDQDITVVMPNQQQVNKERTENKEAKTFTKHSFTYDQRTDTYTCPEGQKLEFRFFSTAKQGHRIKNYRPQANVCKACVHFGRCTNQSQGRKITRHELEHVREHLDAVYQSPPGQEIYRRRKIKSELPFAQIKHNGGIRRFLLRGLSGTNAEFSLLAVAHNIVRMMTILSIPGLLNKIQTV